MIAKENKEEMKHLQKVLSIRKKIIDPLRLQGATDMSELVSRNIKGPSSNTVSSQHSTQFHHILIEIMITIICN